jgi:hypothetical protein
MKPQRAQKLSDDPSIKGNLTADQIVETDWKRNYEKKGIPLLSIKKWIKRHVDTGGQVVRLRNTLVLLTMDKGSDEAMFHTITADVYEVYMTMMQLLALSMAKARNVETMYTYVNDKSPYRMARKLFGDTNVDFEESDLEQEGKYKMTIDVGDYYRAGQKTAEARARG